MNGPLAQIVALTCHGNASIGGLKVPPFFPENSTCQFCDSVVFLEFKKTLFGRTKQIVVGNTPDEWFAGLIARGATRIRLARTAQNHPVVSDRMSAGFVGVGGTWIMEVIGAPDRSEFWAARWEVGNQDAPNRRIWRVTYALLGRARTMSDARRDMSVVQVDFRRSLEAIHAFAVREKCDGFVDCFEDALRALDTPAADIGYHGNPISPRSRKKRSDARSRRGTNSRFDG